MFSSQAQWAIFQWPSRLWLEYYSIVCLHLRRKVLIVRHTPFSRIPGSQLCVEMCDWAKMYRPVPLSSWAVLKCIMILTLQFSFLWGRYQWMPNLKSMQKWRTMWEHTWKLWMQMYAWIYRTKLRNRWVKISTVHFQKSIRVIFEPVTFEISIDCMNLWRKNSEEDPSES